MTITIDVLPTLLVLFYAVPALLMIAYNVNEWYTRRGTSAGFHWKWHEFFIALAWPVAFLVFRVYNYLRKRRLYEYRVGFKGFHRDGSTWEDYGWYLRPGKKHSDRW
jgi:hypothetical protein